jgi:hypothetical protein
LAPPPPPPTATIAVNVTVETESVPLALKTSWQTDPGWLSEKFEFEKVAEQMPDVRVTEP